MQNCLHSPCSLPTSAFVGGKRGKICVKDERDFAGGVAQWLSARLRIKGLLVPFPVRAHAWVIGQVPGRGRARGNYTLMFLSPSFSFPSSL